MAEAAAAFVVKMLALKGAEAAVAAAVVNVAVNVAAYAAVSAITRQNGEQKQQGGLIDLQLNSAAPRQLVIGKRMTGGVLIDWYLAGTNNTKLYMPVYLSEGPCGQVTRVFADGRAVWTTPLVHGVRTTIPDFRSGGDRLWLTYYDGRVGQTADATLVALGQGWTSANTMTGCAYVVVECQWDSDNMRSPPSLSFEMEGAKLYDRRLDTTAGGSGSHRIDNPATWAFSDNPMVALDHFLLGRYWDGTRTFGIGLSADEVPYSYFAAQANICDEDVDLKAGGTQKRYRANGFIAANEDYASTITKLCTAMAARPADFGGRFGVIGVESKTPVLTIDDGDLIAGVQEVYTPKRSWAELVGEVEGRFQDPAQLYQPTPYPNITDATWEAEDGGEPKLMTFDLEFETHVERAQRLATLKARAERRQATLSGVYPLWTVELERGDWFIRTGAKWGEDGKTFEVIERVLNTETYTVTIVSQEVDATDSAWDESVAADGPPTPLAATDELSAVTAPSLTVTSNPIVGAASNTPALKIAFTNPTDPRVHTMFVEVYRASDDLKVATVPVTIPDADEEVIIQNGIADGVLYDVRAKYLTPGLSSAWSTTVSATTGSTYAVGAADSVAWSGVTDDGGRPDDNADVTAANTAAAITGQGAFATLNTVNSSSLIDAGVVIYTAMSSTAVRLGTNITRNDGSTSLTDALAVTSLGTAAAIASQGALATLGQVNLGASGRVYRDDGSTHLTDALAVTSLGTASAITSQGAFATMSSITSSIYVGAGVIVYTALASTAVRLGTNITRNDGTTSLTDALAVTSLGTAAAISGQGWGATASQAAAENAQLYPSLGSGVNLLPASDWDGLFPAAGGSVSLPPGLLAYYENDPNNRFSWAAIGSSQLSGFLVAGSGGIFIQQNEDLTYSGTHYAQFYTVLVPAIAGKTYFASLVTAGAQPCGGYMIFYAADGTTSLGTGSNDSYYFPATAAGGTKLSDWDRAYAKSTAPSGTAFVQFTFYRLGVSTAGASYWAFRRPMIEEAVPSQSAPSPWANGLRTVYALGTDFIRRADYSAAVTEALVVTSLGTASAITSQGGLATLSFVTISTNLRLADGTTVATTAMVVTASGTAAAIASQGSQATANAQRGSSYSGTPVEGSWWADTTTSQLKFYTGGAWNVVATIASDNITATASPSSSTVSHDYTTAFSTGSITITPAGGSGYTYAWEVIKTGGAGPAPTMSSYTASSSTGSCTLSAGQDVEGFIKCTVSATGGKSVVVVIPFSFNETS